MKETEDIQYTSAADIALYSLPDKDIKAIKHEIQRVKPKLKDHISGAYYKLPYSKFIILLQSGQSVITVIDIINNKLYKPNNSFNPYPL